jgi:hypothetical protein
MRAKEYDVLEMAVEQGIRFGLNRIRKRNIPLVDDKTNDHHLHAVEALVDETLGAVCQWFDFERLQTGAEGGAPA